MRTVSCLLVIIFFFSLPWRLNSNVSPAINTKRNNEHITDHQQSTHPAEGPMDPRHNSTDAVKKNVVLLSGSVHLTSESEWHVGDTSSSAHTLNRRKKRNTGNNENNLTTPEGTTISSRSIRTQDILHTTPFTSPVQRPEERTTGEFMDTTEHRTQGSKQEMPSSFTSTSNDVTQPNITDVYSNKISTNSDVHTLKPTLDTTVQFNTVTHTHTFTVIPQTESTETKSMKTTQKQEITASSSKSVMISTTILKTTIKVVVPSLIDTQKKNPGPAVAAIIGTTLIVMFIAIIFILVRKRKIQKKQLENPEWAGPSPFLDVEVQPNPPSTDESESVIRRGFSQISKYLPQRFSKHLTFGRDTNEEVFMSDILQGSSTFCTQNVEEVQATKGATTLIQDLPKTEENENNQGAASADSADIKSPAVAVDIKKSDNQNDVTKAPSQDTVFKILPPLVSIDLDSFSEETAPSQIPDNGNVPQAPPLPSS